MRTVYTNSNAFGSAGISIETRGVGGIYVENLTENALIITDAEGRERAIVPGYKGASVPLYPPSRQITITQDTTLGQATIPTGATSQRITIETYDDQHAPKNLRIDGLI